MKKYLVSIFLLGLITFPDKISGIKTSRDRFFDGFQLFSNIKPNIQLRFLQENNDVINNENVLTYFPNPLNNPEKW